MLERGTYLLRVSAVKKLFGFDLSVNADDAEKIAREACAKNGMSYQSHEIEGGTIMVIGKV